MPIQFFLIIITFLVLIVGAHFFVYFSILHFWQLSSTFWLKISTLILSLSFTILTLLTQAFYSRILGGLYALSAVLLGTLYWLFWASVLAFFIWGILYLLALNSIALLVGKILLGVGLGVSLYGLIHSSQTKVVEYEVKLPNLPSLWENKRIVLVADTHFGNVRNKRFAQKIADFISAQKPELVLVAGDFVDGPPTNVAEIVPLFASLKAPKGIYFANGNHESYHKGDALYEAFKKAGVHVLNDSMIDVEGLQIAGANYVTTTNNTSQAKVLKKLSLDSSKPSILIKHIPNALESAEDAGIDLQVSGHSHQGQVWPGPWLTRKVFGPFAYGQQKLNELTVITTSGAGTWGPPQRVGTNSEIAVITLKKKG